MSRVKISGGVGYSSHTGATYYSFSADAKPTAPKPSAQTEEPQGTQPDDDEPGAVPWSRWGVNNLLPNEMAASIEKCGALSSSIHDMTKLYLGKGARPYKLVEERPDGSEVLEPIKDSEIKDFLQESDIYTQSFNWIKDFGGMGNLLGRLKFTKDGTKIGLAVRHDAAEMRLKKKEAGVIKKVYMSGEWENIFSSTDKDKDLIEKPLLPYLRPAAYLTDLKPEQRKNKEFCWHGKLPGWLRHYYGMPLWKAADEWVEISIGVPRMKKAIFENAIRLKYIVIIYDTYWTRQWPKWLSLDAKVKDEHRQATYDMIDQYLAGADNAYKSIFVPGTFHDASQKWGADIEIKSVEDTTKAGELLPDSAAADKQIMFSQGFNPAINGANLLNDGSKGGAGSGSDIREAIMAMILKGELERQQIVKILDIISTVNGWHTKYPDLVWRFPGLVLTTLDKGKSTEPVKS